MTSPHETLKQAAAAVLAHSTTTSFHGTAAFAAALGYLADSLAACSQVSAGGGHVTPYIDVHVAALNVTQAKIDALTAELSAAQGRCIALEKVLKSARRYFGVRAQNVYVPTPNEMIAILDAALSPTPISPTSEKP